MFALYLLGLMYLANPRRAEASLASSPNSFLRFGAQNLAAVSCKGASASAGKVEDSDKASSLPSGYPSHRRCNSGHDPTAVVRSTSSEISAYVTIIGNYVRADADAAGSFFQDIIPALLVLGVGSGGRDERGWKREGDWGHSKRLPPRLSAVLRSLVDSTRRGAAQLGGACTDRNGVCFVSVRIVPQSRYFQHFLIEALPTGVLDGPGRTRCCFGV